MKPRARIITMAWGRSYFETLRSVALPAVLAPGNLPALTRMLDCELAVVTEQGYFDELRASPVFRRLEEYCPVRLLMMDDLVVSPGRYGMALTFALHRGFADLGVAMTDHYLIFFNADFILADGSLRAVGHRVLAGEQLIHAPSYCVIQERAEPMLRQQIDPGTHTLTIPRRDMADMILTNRHYTIRGKTVNQRVFHSAYIEQFYWQIDNYTLLGRQMPIALVCMKPERVVRQMRTFWDYGVVSELCPNAKPCVLGDSDDFCMLELRRETTMLEQMALGWPTPEEIAQTLGKFVTEDQKKLGRYPLVLHSRDLPDTLEAEQRHLGEFVEHVYRSMPERAVPHLNHPFWLDHLEPFLTEYFAGNADTRESNPGPSALAQTGSLVGTLPKPRGGMRTRLQRSLRNAVAHFKGRCVGRVPFIRPLHPYYTVLTPTYKRLERELVRPGRRILVVSDQNGPLTQFVRERSRGEHNLYEAPALLQSDTPAADVILDEVLRHGPFDFLVSEVTFGALLKFSALFRAVQPAMAEPSVVLVFHLNTAIAAAHLNAPDVITQGTIAIGRSEIFFTGSDWARRAVVLSRKATVVRRSRYFGLIAFAGLAGASMISAAIASGRSPKLTNRTIPKTCLAMTMCYELPASPARTTTA